LKKIPKANTYPNLIFNLVKWAKDNGKLRKLVVGASIENPGNPKLQVFVEAHLQVLLEMDPNPIPSNVLGSLIQALKSITDFQNIVLPACDRTLSDLDLNNPDLREQLLNDDLTPTAKWLILLDLFLKTWIYDPEEHLYIVAFVRNLELLTRDATKSDLTDWLSDLLPEQEPASIANSTPQSTRPPDKVLKSLQAYFLIVVEPAEITIRTGSYNISGYLITQFGTSDEFTRIRTLNLSEPLPEESESNSEDALDPEPEGCKHVQGVSCNLHQVEDCLPEWLLQAQEAIDLRCANLQSEYNLSFRPVYDLTIEFWLPFEHLTATADAWKIYGKPVRLKNRNRVVGREYRVVVRSYDRFSDPDAFNELNRTWQDLDALLRSSADASEGYGSEDTPYPSDAAALPSLNAPRGSSPRLAVLPSHLEQACLGLALTCPKESKLQREVLFSWILEQGVPMALWSRHASLVTLTKQMEALLSNNTLPKIDPLLRQIKELRSSANEAHSWGKHLAIWCDEPKRLMELKQYLKSGRLSA
jgi:hypothetical protein